ncbi:hypothetical protein N9438_03690 [Flavobacteriaceae bacterium]|nr:hypothetical protein [Flavobacteriaceae bacterium]
MITEEDIKHFVWLHERIVYVYKESENTDYLIRMRQIIKKMEQLKN